MGVLVPIRALVMALVGWVGHHHVGDLTWTPRVIYDDDNGGGCVGSGWLGYQHTGDHLPIGCVDLSFEHARPQYRHEQT